MIKINVKLNKSHIKIKTKQEKVLPRHVALGHGTFVSTINIASISALKTGTNRHSCP